MKIKKNILTALALMSMVSLTIRAQEFQNLPDTSAVRQQKEQKVKEQERTGEQAGQQGQNGNQSQNQAGQGNQSQNQAGQGNQSQN